MNLELLPGLRPGGAAPTNPVLPAFYPQPDIL